MVILWGGYYYHSHFTGEEKELKEVEGDLFEFSQPTEGSDWTLETAF